MSICDAVYKCMENVIGLPEDELRTMPELNLRENELIDSLSMAELISSVEIEIGKKIDLKQIKTEQLTTINGIISAIEALCG